MIFQKLKRLLRRENSLLWRWTIQWLMLGWCLFLGVQFALFVRHFQNPAAHPYYLRPPGVEGFLPIGALVSFKAWLVSGYLDPVHPAALVLFVTFLAMALLARKSFCAFICPVGTLSEPLWKLGKRLFGRNFRIWGWLDILLRGSKYALLLFFVKLIMLDMPATALQGFLSAPYWAVADIRMLHFFTGMSWFSATVIGVLSLLSLVYKNFWCRYLCPYGALLGLLSWCSPLVVRRFASRCTDCGTCSRVCPALLDVQHKQGVYSPECTGCLTCVSQCPEEGALQISFWKRPLPSWVFTLLVVAIFAAGVVGGKYSGHWQSSLTYQDYRQLVPVAEKLGH